MNDHSERRVEELLRSGCGSARRALPSGFRESVLAAVESSPARSRPRGEAHRSRHAAAAILVAAGLASFVLLRSLSRPNASQDPDQFATRAGSVEFEETDERTEPVAGETFAQLATAAPRNLRRAIDDALFAELWNIESDATSAARFFVGRLPASLVAPRSTR